MDVIATLYAYPTNSQWSTLQASVPTVKYAIVDICAPDGSGPGCNDQPWTAANPDWVTRIAALRAAGIDPLVYLWTDYGATPESTIDSELAQAKAWYGLTDPMFDGTATNDYAYYDALYGDSIAAGATTVEFNAGAQVPQTYMAMGADAVFQVFEGTSSGFESTTFPSWMQDYPSSQFAATISAGTSSTIGPDVQHAFLSGIGQFYEDDEAEPPNYSTLSSFWSTEVAYVAAS